MGGIARAAKQLFSFLLLGVCFLITATSFLHAASADTVTEAEDLTDECKITSDFRGGKTTRYTSILDNDAETRLPLSKDQYLALAWEENVPVAQVYVAWYRQGQSCTVVQTDISGAELQRELLTSGDLFYAQIQLVEGCRSICLYATDDAGLQISSIRAYGAGTLPGKLHLWQPVQEQADLLLVAAHPDDELIFLGGILPHYVGQHARSASVIYMTSSTRIRQREALNGLWLCGLRTMPVFLGLFDLYSHDRAEVLSNWNEERTIALLTEQLRRLQPQVVVTHSLDGEYGHGAHCAAAYCVMEAVAAASDPQRFPESFAEYGAWTVKKLYLRGESQYSVSMDWNVPLSYFDGKTALEVTRRALACHISQAKTGFRPEDSGKLGCANYELVFSTVGKDILRNDLFENVDPKIKQSHRFAGPYACQIMEK